LTVNDAIKYVVDNIPFNYDKESEQKTDAKKKSGNARTETNSIDNPDFKPTWRKPLGIGLGAVGLSAMGVGCYYFYLYKKQASLYVSAKTQAQADDYFTRKNSSLTTAVMCVAGGAALVVGGLVLYPWNSETAKAKTVTIAPIIGTCNGISIVFNF
jgi:hypothetical protein